MDECVISQKRFPQGAFRTAKQGLKTRAEQLYKIELCKVYCNSCAFEVSDTIGTAIFGNK